MSVVSLRDHLERGFRISAGYKRFSDIASLNICIGSENRIS